MRTILLSLAIACTLPACVTDDTAPRRHVGDVIIDPVPVTDPSAPLHHSELDGLATPVGEYYCDADADCGPGLTCIVEHHSCFDARGRLAEQDIALGTIGDP